MAEADGGGSGQPRVTVRNPDDNLGFHASLPPEAVAVGIAPQQIVAVSFQQTINQSLLSADQITALKAADPEALALLYRMMDRQQTHDHAVERQSLRSESGYRLFGMFTAMMVTAMLCGSAIVAIYMDHPTVAAIFGGSTVLTGVAGLFIRGRDLRPSEAAAEPQAPGFPTQQRPTRPPSPPQ